MKTWTPDEAWRVLQENRGHAHFDAGQRVILTNLPNGFKVEGNFTQAIGEYLRMHPSGPTPTPIRADQQRIHALEREQRDKQADRERVRALEHVTDSDPYARFLARRIDLWQTITEGVEPRAVLVAPWLYERTMTALTGAPGAGKTWLLHYATIAILTEGKSVLILDEELSPADTADRLSGFGITEEQTSRLHYFNRVLSLFPSLVVAGQAFMQYVTEHDIALIVLDSVSKAFPAFGLSENDNTDATKLMASVFTPLVHVAGRTFLFADHVIKDEFASSRYGRGAGAKLADTNIQWIVEMTAPVSRDQRGKVVLTKEKDTFSVAPATVRFAIGPDDDGIFTVTVESSVHHAPPKARAHLVDTIRALHGEANAGMTFTDWHIASKLAEKTFKNHRRALLDDGAVLQDGSFYRVSQRGLEAYFSTRYGEGP